MFKVFKSNCQILSWLDIFWKKYRLLQATQAVKIKFEIDGNSSLSNLIFQTWFSKNQVQINMTGGEIKKYFLFSLRNCMIPVKNLKSYLFGPILNQHFGVFMSDKFRIWFFKANVQSFQKRLSNSWLDIFLEGAFNQDFWCHLGNDVSDRSTETIVNEDFKSFL